MYTELKTCCICQSPVTQVLDMGVQYVVDFVKEKDESLLKAPLVIMRCDKCGLVQLKHKVSPDRLYRKFWYRSGINKQMQDELLAIVQHAEEVVELQQGDKVLDIGCNDGTLLGWYDKGVMTFGVDPCDSLVQEGLTSTPKRIDVGISDYFSADAIKSIGRMLNIPVLKFKIITAIAMFYDVANPVEFLQDCKELLHHEGVLVLQMNYLGTMLRDTAVDFICHEHLTYYSVIALEEAVKRAGLDIQGLEISQSNGGSIRVYITHPEYQTFCNRDSDLKAKLYQNFTYVKMQEIKFGLDTVAPFHKFEIEAQNKMAALRRVLAGTNKKLYAYGASTRGTVLSQFLFQHGGADKIIAVAERDEHKYGLRMVGTWWPIVDEATFRKDAELALVLPWHFKNSILEREEEWIKGGGKFIFPLPTPMITQLNATVSTGKLGVEA